MRTWSEACIAQAQQFEEARVARPHGVTQGDEASEVVDGVVGSDGHCGQGKMGLSSSIGGSSVAPHVSLNNKGAKEVAKVECAMLHLKLVIIEDKQPRCGLSTSSG
ncbi:hypothetical protein ACLOJK_014346 [Asimina triloba]